MIVTDKSCSQFEKLLHFSVAFRGLQHKLFFCVPFEQLLNPSIYPFSFTDWIRFMHKAPLMPLDCLWQALMQTPWLPWAITLNTQERARAADLWEVERGQERAERDWWNKRKETESNCFFFHLSNRFALTYKNCSFHFMTKIHPFVLFIRCLFSTCWGRLRNLTAVLILPSPSEPSPSVCLSVV